MDCTGFSSVKTEKKKKEIIEEKKKNGNKIK